jgi:hypothetical protein
MRDEKCQEMETKRRYTRRERSREGERISRTVVQYKQTTFLTAVLDSRKIVKDVGKREKIVRNDARYSRSSSATSCRPRCLV